MHIFNSKTEIREEIQKLKDSGKKIGFVPTMGALHDGHLSLVDKSNSENDITVVSIFVNPTQFNNPEDLEKYPINTERDLKLLKSRNTNYVFLPSVEEIYGRKVESEFYDFGNLDKVMEGEHRKNHFDGVATIVKLLFETTLPSNAYFGEKDFQQLQIIRRLVEIENLDLNIVPCEIVREADGLAMSSRNVRLSEEHRKEAPFIYKTILEAKKLSKTKSLEEVKIFVEEEFKNKPLFDLEYFEIRDESNLSQPTEYQQDKKYRAFIAVFAQNIRLIDNIQVF